MNFAARKVKTRRCELCFATSHTEQECAQRGGADPGVSDRLRYLESTVIAMIGPVRDTSKDRKLRTACYGFMCNKSY